MRTYGRVAGGPGRAYRGQKKPGAFASSQRVRQVLKRVTPFRPSMPSPGAFYASVIENYRVGRDDWAWGCCPFHADSNPSFSMNLRTGSYKCMSSGCGAAGGNIVGFVSAKYGFSRDEALRFLEQMV